jgi:PAS domain S-box-containing protein
LFIGGPVTVFKWEARPGWPVVYVSPNVSQFGYHPTDLLSGVLSYADLIHPGDVQRVVAEVTTYTAEGKATFEQEYRIRRADGHYRWIYDFTRVVRGKDGEATHYDGYILDITERQQTDRELQLKEARYRALVEGSIQGVCVLQRDGAILFANPALAAIFGYDHPGEMIGSSVLRLIAPHDRGRMNRYAVARARGGAAPIRYEFQGIKRDGAPLWLEVQVSVVAWDGSAATLATLIDITARKEAEAALRQSEEQYRTLVEQIHDGVFIIQDSIVRFVNAACAHMLGWTVQELTGVEIQEVLAPEDYELVADRHRRRQEGESVPSRYEFRLLHKNGVSQVSVELNATLIQHRGRPAVLGAVRDITERKRAEERLREEAEINAAFARVAQTMIVSLDTTTIVERLCRIATEVLGCDCSHASLWFSEENAYRMVAGYGDTPEQWEMIRSVKIPGAVGQGVASLMLKTGSLLEVEETDLSRPFPEGVMHQFGVTACLAVALRRGETVIGALIASYRGRRGFGKRQKRLAHGIAQIASLALANAQLLEEVERSNRVKEDFVSTMSHELRTPLNIILGYNQLLREESFGPVTTEQAGILDRVQKNAQELLELINATLDLSRLQSRRVPFEAQEILIPELLSELEAQMQQLNRNPSLLVRWTVAPDLPVLCTDATKLRMVLKNLLTNALKFTEAGTVSVSIKPHAEGVVFEIADTGSGIAPEELAVIFEPFRQGGAFATRRQGGVGLGLYIVQQLLDLLGGKVTVQSELGKGSTFSVWLPYAQP